MQCPELENGKNASDNGLSGWGKKVVYECESGYSLSDNSDKITRTCQKNGTWSGAAPVCLSKYGSSYNSCEFYLHSFLSLEQCQAPPPVPRAQIAPSKNQYNQGSTVHYTCEPGYELRGNAQRTCGTGGEWIGDEPSCGCQGQVSDTGEKNILFVFPIPTFFLNESGFSNWLCLFVSWAAANP